MKQYIKHLGTLLFYGALFFLLVGYILYPMMNTVTQALWQDGHITFRVFREYLSNQNNLSVITNTLWVGIGAVVCCGILGTALAVYMHFAAFRLKKFVHILLLSPMMIPGIIIVIAFIQLYGESGMVTKAMELLLHLDHAPFAFEGLPAILFVITYTQYVYFYLNVSVALKYVDYSAIEAAMSLGAGKCRLFFEIILPAVLPAVLTSSIMTFVSGIGAYAAPNLIGGGYKVLSTQIVRSKANNQMALASVQVMILFLMCILVMMMLQHYKKKHRFTQAVRPTAFSGQGSKRSVFRILCNLLIGLQLIMILLPIVGILYLSFNTTHSIMTQHFPTEYTLQNYVDVFESRRVFKPLVNSLKMSLTAMGAGLILTVPISYRAARRKDRCCFGAKYLMMLPWCMPVSVIAINLINAFNVKSVFAFGASLIGGYAILPIAYTITALPLLLSSNDVAMESFNPILEEASQSLGASPWRTMLCVVLPNVAPGILSGGILVFIRTIGEYTMSSLLYGVYNRPISISMVVNMQEYNVGVSLAYGVLVIGISYLALALVLKLDRKRYIE